MGTLPTQLGQLHKAQTIYLDNNGLHGLLPEEMFEEMTLLATLGLQNNQFSGTISPNMGRWSSMRELTLGQNDFSGTIPSQVAVLEKLMVFDIHGNDITGAVPFELCGIPFKSLVADCAPDSLGERSVGCDCCTKCCEPSSGICQAV